MTCGSATTTWRPPCGGWTRPSRRFCSPTARRSFRRRPGQGIALTLSGHYHGGQIKLILPGGDVSLAHLRTPWPEGLYRIDDSHLYVSRGIGTTFTPVRLNARPEVTVINLT